MSRPQAGFTLLELLIVITVIALSTGLSVVALRDSSGTQLEQEAGRLSALLDAARVESRITGRMVTWRPMKDSRDERAGVARGASGGPRDFVFEPLGLAGSATAGAAAAAPGQAQATDPPGGVSSAEEWPSRWLHEGTTAEVVGAARVVLGPEPLIPPQRIRLQRGGQQVVLATDGLGGFRVETSP